MDTKSPLPDFATNDQQKLLLGNLVTPASLMFDSVWYSEDPNFVAPPEPSPDFSTNFATTGTKWGPSGTFGTTGGTVTWSIAGAGLTNQTGQSFFTGQTVALSSFLPADFTTQITNAFAAWAQVANINFVQVSDGGGNFGVGTTGNIRIGGGFIDGFDPSGSIVGRAFFPPSGGNANTRATNGDLIFDSGDAGHWSDALLFATALHEIGHTLGLDHVPQDNPTAVMNPTLHIGLPLQPDDIAGVQTIYGQVSHAPVITSNGGGDTATVAVAENLNSVTTVAATDADAGQTITFSLVTGGGSPDSALFTLNTTNGTLAFTSAPDFENPTDADHNNTYIVQVRASDDGSPSQSDVQTITVQVTDVAPRIAGGNGVDILTGTAENDHVLGFAGQDSITGGVGNDILTGGGSGSPQNSLLAPVSWTGAGNDSQGWYVGDYNGDGRSDIFRYHSGVSGAEVLLSNGSSFDNPISWTGAGNDGHWYVGDFNGDGRSDIFTYANLVSGALVSISNGSSFDNPISWTSATNGTEGWFVGDFNGDGRDDIFRYSPGVSGAQVFLSNGTSFTDAGSWTGAGNDGTWILGDFNGDGRTDIGRTSGGAGLQVFLSTGSSFQSAGNWTNASAGTQDWYVGDLNGDGRDDIFRYNPGVSGAEAFLSNGSSFVTSGSWTGAGNDAQGWYVGDFNGGGTDDIFRYAPGFSGADTLVSDVLSSAGDHFKFLAGGGKDVITDFRPTGANHDVIELDHNLAANFTAAMADATQVGTNVVMAFDANTTLTLNNVVKAALTSSDFLFV